MYYPCKNIIVKKKKGIEAYTDKITLKIVKKSSINMIKNYVRRKRSIYNKITMYYIHKM